MVLAPIVFSLLLVLGACQGSDSQKIAMVKPAIVQKTVPASDDKAEVLLRHLSQRANEADHEIVHLQGEVLKHDNMCLEEQIATIEGKAHSTYPKSDSEAVKAARSLRDLDRLAQGLLDAEAVIEYHNERHPEHPQADIKDLLRQLCGDCTQQRASRDAQLKKEEQDHTDSSKK
jgi:hypothetical protein